MDDFHVKHLSDAQMAVLNPIIRQALYDGIVMMDNDNDANVVRNLSPLISMIPDYWEIPGQDKTVHTKERAA